MIQELDTVVLLHDLREYGLVAGDLGTVVHRYSDGTAFEVEFLTAEGRTIAVVTLESREVRPTSDKEILHVRELAS